MFYPQEDQSNAESHDSVYSFRLSSEIRTRVFPRQTAVVMRESRSATHFFNIFQISVCKRVRIESGMRHDSEETLYYQRNFVSEIQNLGQNIARNLSGSEPAILRGWTAVSWNMMVKTRPSNSGDFLTLRM